jgi:hypothetical protein
VPCCKLPPGRRVATTVPACTTNHVSGVKKPVTSGCAPARSAPEHSTMRAHVAACV